MLHLSHDITLLNGKSPGKQSDGNIDVNWIDVWSSRQLNNGRPYVDAMILSITYNTYLVTHGTVPMVWFTESLMNNQNVTTLVFQWRGRTIGIFTFYDMFIYTFL